MTTIDFIKDKNSLHKIFKDMKCDYLGMLCKDSKGNEIRVYLLEYEFENGDVLLLEDCLGELRLYATDDNDMFEEYNEMFNRLDDYFYGFDSYPTYCDWIKFPLTDVRLFPMDSSVQTNELAEYLINKDEYVVIHPNKKDGLNILIYDPQTKSIHEEFSGIKRCKWLKEVGCLVYETFKDAGGNITYLKEGGVVV